MKVNISDIKIQPEYEKTRPSKAKLKECEDFYLKYHKLDRYIGINSDGYLVDGYVGYLVAKKFGLQIVKIKKTEEKLSDGNIKYLFLRPVKHTYVYGIHDEQHTNKKYVWRIPDNKNIKLHVGDKAIVATKHGLSTISVTDIQRLPNKPINMRIRKVVRKLA